MNNSIQIRRVIIITLIQILILKQLDFSFGEYISFSLFLYPIAIIFAPLSINRTVLLLLAFTYGLVLDVFYDSIGLHAFCSVFTAYWRKFALNAMQPRGGYKGNSLFAGAMGQSWVFQYLLLTLIPHILLYCSLDALSVSLILQILSKTFFNTLLSLLFVYMYFLIFNPK